MKRAPKTRKDGEGSVFQRGNDGLWVATVPGKKRKAFTSKIRAVAEAKRERWLKHEQQPLEPFHPVVHDLDMLTELLVERLQPLVEEMVKRAVERCSNGRVQ